MYKYTDYYDKYGRIMQFNKNKSEPIHRWYPFVEGYSKEFIQSIIKECKLKPNMCLEPFSGSGTTALELQDMGIRCYSFEVNPLMYLVAKVKMESNYDKDTIISYHKMVKSTRCKIRKVNLSSEFPTLYENDAVKKWNYHKETANAIEKLKRSINKIDRIVYRNLFEIALAAILLDVSNMYRNGKCLSYKKDWKDRIIKEEDVFKRFDDKIKMQIEDIENRKKIEISNKDLLFNEDSRQVISSKIEDNSIDLIITSPPYLNSRDYTDTYMLELRTLNFTLTNTDVRKLRERTLRSHVQIKWKDSDMVDNQMLRRTLLDLKNAASVESMWNNSIIDMVRLYFVDMKIIFDSMYKKMKKGGRVYFNVSNSAYFKILVNTLEICSSLAEDTGFKVKEIRKARELKTSPQQQKEVGKLLEGVIVLEK